jgi:glucose 1-dehydrogenase
MATDGALRLALAAGAGAALAAAALSRRAAPAARQSALPLEPQQQALAVGAVAGGARPLAGKTALVTGAGRGIGKGAALALARLGADIVVNDLPGDEAAAATAALVVGLGCRATVALADVTDPAAVDEMVRLAVAAHGRIDIAVANAAWSDRQPLAEQEVDLMRRTIEVSQVGVMLTVRAAARQMLAQPRVEGQPGAHGKIVIMSSIMGNLVLSNKAPAYSMSKCAIAHLGRCVASELIDARINVNVICPGWIDTEGERKWTPAKEIEEAGACMPWGRLGTPADIGSLTAFLCSDAADYITGSVLDCDGGYSVSTRLDIAKKTMNLDG